MNTMFQAPLCLLFKGGNIYQLLDWRDISICTQHFFRKYHCNRPYNWKCEYKIPIWYTNYWTAIHFTEVRWKKLPVYCLPIIVWRWYEMTGSYLQHHDQHQVFRAPIEADTYSQAQTNKELRLSFHIYRSKLTASWLTDNTTCSVDMGHRWSGCVFAWSQLLGRHSMIFLFIWWDHWLWFCFSEAVRLQCCFPLEPKSFPRLMRKLTENIPN